MDKNEACGIQSPSARPRLGNSWRLQDCFRLQDSSGNSTAGGNVSLENLIEPTKRVNAGDQRLNRFLVSLILPIRRHVKSVDKTILRRSLIGSYVKPLLLLSVPHFFFVIADTAEIIMAVFYDHNFVSLFGLLFLCEAINQRTMMDCTSISHRQ